MPEFGEFPSPPFLFVKNRRLFEKLCFLFLPLMREVAFALWQKPEGENFFKVNKSVFSDCADSLKKFIIFRVKSAVCKLCGRRWNAAPTRYEFFGRAKSTGACKLSARIRCARRHNSPRVGTLLPFYKCKTDARSRKQTIYPADYAICRAAARTAFTAHQHAPQSCFRVAEVNNKSHYLRAFAMRRRAQKRQFQTELPFIL